MKWRLLLIVSLLAGLLLCPGVIYADEPEDSNLDVDITIVGDNPNVDVDVYGDNPTINVNGHNINTYSTSGDGQEHFDWKSRKLIKDLDVTVNIMANGLAKVILETMSQDSTITSVIAGVSDHSAELRELEDTALSLSGGLSALEESWDKEITMLQARQRAIQSDFNLKLKLLLGVIGALIVSNIVIIAKIRKA